MTSEEKQRQMDTDELAANLEVVYTAFCIHCASDKSSNNSEDAFAKELYAEGWRVSDMGDVCCPKCAKIHVTN